MVYKWLVKIKVIIYDFKLYYLLKDSLAFAKRNPATIKRNTTYSGITSNYIIKIIEVLQLFESKKIEKIDEENF